MSLFRYTQECLDSAQGNLPLVAQGPHGRQVRPVGIRVFENSVLEWISKAHPITPILWTGPCIFYGLYAGITSSIGLWATLGLFLVGWLLWTLQEYVLHRFIFHLPAATPKQKFRYFMMHGYHHDFPNDPLRLVAPPMLGWPLAVIVGSVYYAAFGPTRWLILLAGTMSGYVAYDWTHYYSHHARPTTALGRWVKRYHMQHHYADHDAHYGVSSPLWDVILGTFRMRHQRPPGAPETVPPLDALRLKLGGLGDAPSQITNIDQNESDQCRSSKKEHTPQVAPPFAARPSFTTTEERQHERTHKKWFSLGVLYSHMQRARRRNGGMLRLGLDARGIRNRRECVVG